MAEQLEQMRALENGYRVRVMETVYDSVGVDLPEHIAEVEKLLREEENGKHEDQIGGDRL